MLGAERCGELLELFLLALKGISLRLERSVLLGRMCVEFKLSAPFLCAGGPEPSTSSCSVSISSS